MFPIKQNRPPIAAKPAWITELGGMPRLTSAVQVSAQPATPSGKIATAPNETDTIRTLTQKIEQFNADENTCLLVAIFRNTIKAFSLDALTNDLSARRFYESIAVVPGPDAICPANFSVSPLTPAARTKLYWHTASRIADPGDWETLVLPEHITPQQKDHLLTLSQKRKLTARNIDRPNTSLAEQTHAEAVHLAAINELSQAWQALWEGHPDVIYRCPDLFMGYIVSDHARITNAFPNAGGTYNRRYTPRASLLDGQVVKCMAVPQGGMKFFQSAKRDKHFKVVGESILARGPKATLDALIKHEKKHAKERTRAEISEVLIAAQDDELSHFVDGFFLDMRSGFEKMNLDTVNLYLYHNRDIVLKKMEQTRGFPLLVNYSDQASGRHKFAYVTLNPEGIPVASEQPPSDDRLQN